MAEEAAVQAARSAAAAVTTASAALIEPPRLVGEVPRASPHASAPAVPAPIPSSPAAKSPFPAPELPPRQTTDPSPVRPTSASAAVSPSVITVEQAPTPPARPVPSPPASPVKPFPFPPMGGPLRVVRGYGKRPADGDGHGGSRAGVGGCHAHAMRQVTGELRRLRSRGWRTTRPDEGLSSAIFGSRRRRRDPGGDGPLFLPPRLPRARNEWADPEQQREREEDLEQVGGGGCVGRVPLRACEYLGNRQYRCVLDGKVLSKFSIMRVHVAKKFGGLVHQWAVDRSPLAPGAARRLPGVHSPGVSPAVVHPDLNSQTIEASHSSPVFGVQRPSPTPTSERHITDARLVPSEMDLSRGSHPARTAPAPRKRRQAGRKHPPNHGGAQAGGGARGGAP